MAMSNWNKYYINLLKFYKVPFVFRRKQMGSSNDMYKCNECSPRKNDLKYRHVKLGLSYFLF